MDVYFVAGLILSAMIGVSLGLIGGGGSIITVPVLVYVLGVDVRQAIAMSLAVVGATSVVGALAHHRSGTLRLKTGMLFGSAGILGAFLGSPLTQRVSPGLLLLVFALLMLVVAVVMLARKQNGEEVESRRHQNIIQALLSGFAVGLLTGFLGVGGGFLIVPALVFFGGLSMKESIGTSLLVIAINCAAGLVGHLRYGGFDVRTALLVTALAIAGTLVGTHLSQRISAEKLSKGFAFFVILVALFLVAKNYSALLF